LEYFEDKYFAKTDQILSDTRSMLMDIDEDHDSARENFNKKINRTKILMNINFSQAAQFQGNFKLALNKLDQTQSILKSRSQHLTDLKIIWSHCYLRTHLARAKFSNDPTESLNIFLNATCLKQIIKYDKNDEFLIRKNLSHDHQKLHAEFTKYLIDTLIGCESKEPLYFEKMQKDQKKWNQLIDYIQVTQLNSLEEVS